MINFRLTICAFTVLLSFMTSIPLLAMDRGEKTITSPRRICSSREDIQFWTQKENEFSEKKETVLQLLKHINYNPSCFLELGDLFEDPKLVKDIQKTIQKHDHKDQIALPSLPVKLFIDQFRVYDLLNHLCETKHMRQEGIFTYSTLEKKIGETVELNNTNNLSIEEKSARGPVRRKTSFNVLGQESKKQIQKNSLFSTVEHCEFFNYTDIALLNNEDGYYVFSFVSLNDSDNFFVENNAEALTQQFAKIFSYRSFNQVAYKIQVVPTRFSIALKQNKKNVAELEVKKYAKDPIVYPFSLTLATSDATEVLHCLLHYIKFSDYTKMAADPEALLLFKHIKTNTITHFLSAKFMGDSSHNRLFFLPPRISDVRDSAFSESSVSSSSPSPPGLANMKRDRRSSSGENITHIKLTPRRRSSGRLHLSDEVKPDHDQKNPNPSQTPSPPRSLLKMQETRKREKSALNKPPQNQGQDQDQGQNQNLQRSRTPSRSRTVSTPSRNLNIVHEDVDSIVQGRAFSPISDVKGIQGRPRAQSLGCVRNGSFRTTYGEEETDKPFTNNEF